MEQFTSAQKKDLQLLVTFIRIFCHAKHSDQQSAPFPADLAEVLRDELVLCPDCEQLLGHALAKRRQCPLEPKPSCKHCKIHCYSKEFRAKIREIMAYSGRRMIMRGRLDYLWHYFF